MFLSMRAHDEQSSLVFSGVFSIVWIGEAVVTLQIKLLGGNMSVVPPGSFLVWWSCCADRTVLQFILPVRLHHRLYLIPSGHCRASQRTGFADNRADTGLHRADCLVAGCRSQYPRRLGRRPQPRRDCRVPVARLLYLDWLPLLHQLRRKYPLLLACRHFLAGYPSLSAFDLFAGLLITAKRYLMVVLPVFLSSTSVPLPMYPLKNLMIFYV
jgi:hypothetical protein